MVTSTAIQPVEVDGKHYVNVNIDGCKTNRYGPYVDADAAGAMARQVAGVCRSLFHSGPIVVRQAAAPYKSPCRGSRAGRFFGLQSCGQVGSSYLSTGAG